MRSDYHKDEIRKRIIASIESNRKSLVRTCSELIQIDSSNPPGDCSKIVSYLRSEYRLTGAHYSVVSAEKDYLKGFGHKFPRNNFVCAIGPAKVNKSDNLKKNVGLSIGTHMDVVPAGDKEKWKFPPFSGTIADSKIWGRGACDAKCSLAAQLYAMKAILENGISLHRSLLCIGTVDDEAPKDAIGAGMEFMAREGLGKLGYGLPRFAINAEASGLTSIWGSFNGGLTVKMILRGKVGHPPMGVNALESAVALWNALIKKRNRQVLPKPPRLVWLNGGSDVDFGLTPERTEIIFRIPIPNPRATPKDALNEIKHVAREEEQQQRKSDLRLVVDEIRVLTEGRAFETGKSNLLVKTLKTCATDAGMKATYGGGNVGPGDLQFFLQKGVTGVTYGAGSLDRCHVPNEYVSEEELVAQAKIYALAACRLCALY